MNGMNELKNTLDNVNALNRKTEELCENTTRRLVSVNKKLRWTIFFSLVTLVSSCVTIATYIAGCGFIEGQLGNALSDIKGWDLSACAESSQGREVCFELFRDNDRRILGGMSTVEFIIAQLSDADTNGFVDTNGSVGQSDG